MLGLEAERDRYLGSISVLLWTKVLLPVLAWLLPWAIHCWKWNLIGKGLWPLVDVSAVVSRTPKSQ